MYLHEYSPDDGFPSNPEMKRIFDEDQKLQPGTKIDWAVVDKSDAARREATRKLLNEGALHTGEDYTWAAFVFQHGSTPDDFLMAHTLALALRKGYRDAAWIATATLDRYLRTVQKPQIYGTQFRQPPLDAGAIRSGPDLRRSAPRARRSSAIRPGSAPSTIRGTVRGRKVTWGSGREAAITPNKNRRILDASTK